MPLDRRPGHRVELIEIPQRLFGREVLHEVREVPDPANQDRRPHFAAGKRCAHLCGQELSTIDGGTYREKVCSDATNLGLLVAPAADENHAERRHDRGHSARPSSDGDQHRLSSPSARQTRRDERRSERDTRTNPGYAGHERTAHASVSDSKCARGRANGSSIFRNGSRGDGVRDRFDDCDLRCEFGDQHVIKALEERPLRRRPDAAGEARAAGDRASPRSARAKAADAAALGRRSAPSNAALRRARRGHRQRRTLSRTVGLTWERGLRLLDRGILARLRRSSGCRARRTAPSRLP